LLKIIDGGSFFFPIELDSRISDLFIRNLCAYDLNGP
jgi:hypothetical protein